jgi:hypothetical protein
LAKKRAERSGGGMVLMLSARVPTFVTYSLVKLLNPPFAGLVQEQERQR